MRGASDSCEPQVIGELLRDVTAVVGDLYDELRIDGVPRALCISWNSPDLRAGCDFQCIQFVRERRRLDHFRKHVQDRCEPVRLRAVDDAATRIGVDCGQLAAYTPALSRRRTHFCLALLVSGVCGDAIIGAGLSLVIEISCADPVFNRRG